jgi:hypothetical protein
MHTLTVAPQNGKGPLRCREGPFEPRNRLFSSGHPDFRAYESSNTVVMVMMNVRPMDHRDFHIFNLPFQRLKVKPTPESTILLVLPEQC